MKRIKIKNLFEAFSDIAQRKRAAVKARFKGRRLDVEPSMDVFLEACTKIASKFKEYGYIYAKSGPHIFKQIKPLTYKISFGTSYHNIPGEYVSLNIYANIRSIALKKWRNNQNNPYLTNDWVAGGMSHLISTDSDVLTKWDLADTNHREDIISDIIVYIKSQIFPYFEQFSDPPKIIERLKFQNIPEFSIGSVIEFALCFGSLKDAQEILNRYLTQNPDIYKNFKSKIERLEREGFPDHIVSAYSEQVAWVSKSYGLKIKM